MSYLFRMQGQILATPVGIAPSFGLSPSGIIDEQMVLAHVQSIEGLDLASDAPLAVAFGPVTNAHVAFVRVRTSGALVRVRLSSSQGSQQAVGADPLWQTISKTAPFTAIDLTRPAGVLTTVDVFLGELAG